LSIFEEQSIIQEAKNKIKKDKKVFVVSAECRTPYLLLYNHSKGDDKNKKLLRKNEIRVAPKQQPSAKSTERKNYD